METVTKIGYTELQIVMHDIASELQRKFWGIKHMHLVPITNGGLIPAAMLASALNLKVTTVMPVQSYVDKKQQSKIHITDVGPISFKDVIFIDDIIDTGNTIKQIQKKYDNFGFFVAPIGKPRGIKAIENSLLVKPHIIVPDNVWVEFPWEIPYEYSREPKTEEAERIRKRSLPL